MAQLNQELPFLATCNSHSEKTNLLRENSLGDYIPYCQRCHEDPEIAKKKGTAMIKLEDVYNWSERIKVLMADEQEHTERQIEVSEEKLLETMSRCISKNVEFEQKFDDLESKFAEAKKDIVAQSTRLKEQKRIHREQKEALRRKRAKLVNSQGQKTSAFLKEVKNKETADTLRYNALIRLTMRFRIESANFKAELEQSEKELDERTNEIATVRNKLFSRSYYFYRH